MLDRTFTLTEFSNGQNHNKYWRIICNDSGEVVTKWGRVGLGEQSKNYGTKGERFALSKIAEKREKGYEEQNFLQSTVTKQIAPSDIFSGFSNDPIVLSFMKRISDSNRHKILESTTLTYDSDGLYKTPLGIVTPEGIGKARDILAQASRFINGDSLESIESIESITSKYLRVIPHNIGMKVDISILSTIEKIREESNVLDMLQSSYETAIATPKKETNIGETKNRIELELINSSDDAERLNKFYINSRSKHHSDRMKYKVVNAYKVQLPLLEYCDDNSIEVFHGTGEGNLLSILVNGLKTSPPATAIIAGKMFGNGIYGAINSTKSLGYTNISHTESGWLFVCDFAMGKYYEPHGAYNGPPNGYNSTWAKASKTSLLHDELIVYQNSRTKIKYLLEIK